MKLDRDFPQALESNSIANPTFSSTIRRQQQEEREFPLESVTEVTEVESDQISPEEKKGKLSPNLIKRTFMRTSPKADNAPKVKSPTMYFNKQLFSPRAKTKGRGGNLNVRRFSTDSVFNTQSVKVDRANAIGRRLSKDAGSFLTSSPPDINSRRSSYLDTISSGNKLAGKSPVLSIENVSDCSQQSTEMPRKLSDSESIGWRLATLPKYSSQSFEKQRLLHPQYSLNLGKSDEALSKTERVKEDLAQAKSFHNIPDSGNPHNSSDDEMAKRNKFKLELQSQLGKRNKSKGAGAKRSSNGTNSNPSIRIHVEDTSKPTTARKLKSRHQSLGEFRVRSLVPTIWVGIRSLFLSSSLFPSEKVTVPRRLLNQVAPNRRRRRSFPNIPDPWTAIPRRSRRDRDRPGVAITWIYPRLRRPRTAPRETPRVNRPWNVSPRTNWSTCGVVPSRNCAAISSKQ